MKKHVKIASWLFLIATLVSAGFYLRSVSADGEETAVQFRVNWNDGTHKNLSNGTNSPNGSRLPQIVISDSGNRIMVAFNHQESGSATDNDPYYVESTNNGDSWNAPLPIYESPGVNSIQPSVSYDSSNNAHAVWVEGEDRLMYAPKTGWPSTAIQISDAPNPPTSGPVEVDSPKLVASTTQIMDVVWIQRNIDGLGFPNVYHARSANGGATWNSSSSEIETARASRAPDMLISGNNIHLVWQEELDTNRWEIRYSRSLDGGITWSFPFSISDNSSERSAERPLIEIKKGVLQVIYSEKDVGTAEHFLTDQTIRYVTCSSSCNLPASWSDPSIKASGFEVGANTNNSEVIISGMTIIGDCTIASYHGTKDGLPDNNEVIFNTTSCEDDRWTIPQEVTGSGVRSLRPSLASNDTFVFMVYTRAGEPPSSQDQIRFIRGQMEEIVEIPTIYLPMLHRE